MAPPRNRQSPRRPFSWDFTRDERVRGCYHLCVSTLAFPTTGHREGEIGAVVPRRPAIPRGRGSTERVLRKHRETATTSTPEIGLIAVARRCPRERSIAQIAARSRRRRIAAARGSHVGGRGRDADRRRRVRRFDVRHSRGRRNVTVSFRSKNFLPPPRTSTRVTGARRKSSGLSLTADRFHNKNSEIATHGERRADSIERNWLSAHSDGLA